MLNFLRLKLQRAWAGRRLRRLKLCFLIPGGPNDGFCGQIAMFRRSLDHLGGIYKQATVVAVFGDVAVQELPQRWRPHFERIITYHVPPEEVEKRGFSVQGDARWNVVPDDCDFAIFSDADTIFLRPIDDLLEQLLKTREVAGAIAHWTFPQKPGDDDPRKKWAGLAREFVGFEIPLDYTHTLTRDRDPPSERECPFYLNYGCVIVPRDLVDRIGSTFLSMAPRVEPRLHNPQFYGQVALTLVFYALNIGRRAIDLRYNFPNDEIADVLYPELLKDVRVIHYLRTTKFDRQQIFASPEQFQLFLELELSGSNKVFQDHVGLLTDSRYPF
jgi:hypothetical protein